MRGLDKRERRRGAVAVPVPRDTDDARRHALAHVDHLHAPVGRQQCQARHERDADAGAHESLHRRVVVRAEDDVRLAAGAADRRLDRVHAAARLVADQRLLCDLA